MPEHKFHIGEIVQLSPSILRRASGGRRNRMGALCCGHHSDRTKRPDFPTRHRPLEVFTRKLFLLVQSPCPRRAGRRRHSQTLEHRKQPALHPRCHSLRRCLAHPLQPRHLRQNTQLRLQYSAVQSIRHHRPGSLRCRSRRPQIPNLYELL